MATTVIVNDGVYVSGNYIIINGQRVPAPPSRVITNTTVINNKVFINGYEYKNGSWKRTARALWHLVF